MGARYYSNNCYSKFYNVMLIFYNCEKLSEYSIYKFNRLYLFYLSVKPFWTFKGVNDYYYLRYT